MDEQLKLILHLITSQIFYQFNLLNARVGQHLAVNKELKIQAYLSSLLKSVCLARFRVRRGGLGEAM